MGTHLGAVPETDDYIEPMAPGIEAELARLDWGETLKQRDDLLVQFLEAKRAKDQIP